MTGSGVAPPGHARPMPSAPTASALEADGAITIIRWGLRYSLERGPRAAAPGEALWCVTWDGSARVDHPRFVAGAPVLGRESRAVAERYRERGLRCERVVRRLDAGASLPAGIRVLVRVSIPLPEPELSDEGWERVFVEALLAGRSVAEADRLCRAMLGAGVQPDPD